VPPDELHPTFTLARANAPIIHVFRNRVRPELPETSSTYALKPDASRRDAPVRAIKKLPKQIQSTLKRNSDKFPNTLNTSSKDKAQNRPQQQPPQNTVRCPLDNIMPERSEGTNAVRRISDSKKPERSKSQCGPHLAWAENSHRRPAVSKCNHKPFRLNRPKLSPPPRPRRPPQAPFLWCLIPHRLTPRQTFHKELCLIPLTVRCAPFGPLHSNVCFA